MNDSEVLVKVEGVSKKFCKSLKRSLWYGVQDIATERNPFGSPLRSSRLSGANVHREDAKDAKVELRKDEFWAVKDVSFELKRGECLGLIGRNGCGKTTLLRLIAGIFPPDQGEIAIRGQAWRAVTPKG